MFALIKKEILIQFSSPIFAVVSALFLFLTGIVFTAHVTQVLPDQLPEASIRGMIYFMAIILLFVAPLLSMRSFAEERRSGTLELLKTSPLTDCQILMAKYFGLIFLVVLFLLLTIEFPIFIFLSGHPDVAPMILSYLGLFLLCASFLAIGIFTSILARNQIVAAMISFVIIITLWFLGEIGGTLGQKLSLLEHLHSFSLGVLDAADFAYFIFVILLFLFFSLQILKSERREKNFSRGILSILTTTTVISAAIFLYTLTEKHHWRWDITANKEFSLSEQTENILKNLSHEGKNVKIFAFFKKGNDLDDIFIRRKVGDILSEYAARFPRIDYKMLDPDRDVALTAQYQIKTDGTIVIQSGKNKKEIYKSKLFDYSHISEKSLPAFIGESLFTHSILKVTHEDSKKICFLEGHEERKLADVSPQGLSETIKFLQNNNYETPSISFVTARKIPDDCNALLVAGPQKKLPTPEDELIRDWVKAKGHLFLLLEPFCENPLPETLRFFKIEVHSDLIFDPKKHFVLGDAYLNPVLLPHEINHGLEKMNPILFSARSLSYPQEKEISPLMMTSDEAWGETDFSKEAKYDGTDFKGPLTLGVAIERPAKHPLALVIGDADFASNGLIQAPGNLDLFLNMITWILEDKDQIGIRPQTPEFRTLSLTVGKARWIAYWTQFIYPLLILLGGGIYWFRRRHA